MQSKIPVPPAFEGLIDELAEAIALERTPPSTVKFDPTNWPARPAATPPAADRATMSARYLSGELSGEDQGLESQPFAIDRDAIEKELGLSHELCITDIARIRRAFARKNHPDGMPTDLRERATARMQTANAIIDEYLRSKE